MLFGAALRAASLESREGTIRGLVRVSVRLYASTGSALSATVWSALEEPVRLRGAYVLLGSGDLQPAQGVKGGGPSGLGASDFQRPHRNRRPTGESGAQ